MKKVCDFQRPGNNVADVGGQFSAVSGGQGRKEAPDGVLWATGRGVVQWEDIGEGF